MTVQCQVMYDYYASAVQIMYYVLYILEILIFVILLLLLQFLIIVINFYYWIKNNVNRNCTLNLHTEGGGGWIQHK